MEYKDYYKILGVAKNVFREGDLESTKRYLAQAHSLLTPGNGPISEAMSAIWLGDAYRTLPGGVSVAQVTAAIKCYQDGLRTCSRDQVTTRICLLNQRLGRIWRS